MKKLYIIPAILFLLSFQSNAQHGEFGKKREEIKAKKYAFIESELQLTEKEKQQFMPLFKEYDGKREALHDKRRKMMDDFRQNSLNMSDEELNKLIDEFTDTEIQLAELTKIYTEKFKAVIPPMKIILLHHAENEFKRELLKHAHRNGPGPQH